MVSKTSALVLLLSVSSASAGLDISKLQQHVKQGQQVFKKWHSVRSVHMEAPTVSSGRKLQNITSPNVCSWSSGMCRMKVSVGEEYVSSLPPSSPVRHQVNDWETCAPLTQAACNASMSCQWSFQKQSCDIFSTAYTLPALNTTGCGMWHTYQENLVDEGTCAKSETCPQETCRTKMDIDADGSCANSCRVRDDVDIFAPCGANFSFETSYSDCMAANMSFFESATPFEQGVVLGECLAQDCPPMDSFWRAYLGLQGECSNYTTEAACDKIRCRWGHDSNNNPQCEMQFLTAIADSLNDTCAVKQQVQAMASCPEGASAEDCPSHCIASFMLSCDNIVGNSTTPLNESECSVDHYHILQLFYGNDPEVCAMSHIGSTIEACEEASTESECMAVAAPDVGCSITTSTSTSATTTASTSTATTSTAASTNATESSATSPSTSATTATSATTTSGLGGGSSVLDGADPLKPMLAVVLTSLAFAASVAM